jgi:hypothetical protein
MTRMIQWWRRTVRTGYGMAELAARPGPMRHSDMRLLRSTLTWGLAFPALTVVGLALAARRASLAGALLVACGAATLLLAQTVRIALRRNSPGESRSDAALYAAGCMAAKAPQLLGILRYISQRVRRQRARLIEYK